MSKKPWICSACRSTVSTRVVPTAVDLKDMNVGDTLHVGEMKLPAGVQVTALLHGGDEHLPVVTVYAPKGSEGDGAGA